MAKPDRPRPEKPQEPEYGWGDAPTGRPELVWEHAARPLWAQVLPEHAAVLLMENERLLCRRLADGGTLWEQPSKPLPDELARDGAGLVLAAGRDLRELDPATGRQRWRQRLGADVTSLALDQGAVYATSRGPLFAVERADGRQRWKLKCPEDAELSVYPEANILAVDDPETETVHAYEGRSGAPLWEYSADGQPVVAGPLVDGVVPISSHGQGVAAVDVRSGQVRWRLQSERAFEAAGVLSAGRLHFTDGSVYAVEPRYGEVLWRRTLTDEEDGVFSLRADRDTLFAETWRGRLLALNPEDGSIRWERLLGQVHGLTGDERHIYVRMTAAPPEGHWAVAALSRAAGDLQWELRARRMVPDITHVAGVLLVELKSQVLALRVGAA